MGGRQSRILGDDLLIIGKEFAGFDRTNERLDLLAVDSEGKLVIIELKRDDTGADAHWQAIKYASYLSHATSENIVGMLASYSGMSTDEAETRLLDHLEDSGSLNTDQRIILASHRFAPEVTSAALWLNERSPGGDLVTCVTLTPYRDANTESLYVQAVTIIPLPGAEDYLVGIDSGRRSVPSIGRGKGSPKAAMDRNKNDEVTAFAMKVCRLTSEGLPDVIRPDHTGQWARGSERLRWCNLWYARPPWVNHHLCYRLDLRPQGPDRRRAGVWIRDEVGRVLTLAGISLHPDQATYAKGIFVDVGTGVLDDDFAARIAETLRTVIEIVTPFVDDFYAESDTEPE